MSPLVLALATRRDTLRLAGRLAPELAPGDLVVLSGELGSGKTFFARALARALGVPSDVHVTSPTFALVHELAARIPVAHADLYRLVDPRELEGLGLADRRREGALLVVEWGEPYAAALGGDALLVTLAHAPRGRSVRLAATGARGAQILARLAAPAARPSDEDA